MFKVPLVLSTNLSRLHQNQTSPTKVAYRDGVPPPNNTLLDFKELIWNGYDNIDFNWKCRMLTSQNCMLTDD